MKPFLASTLAVVFHTIGFIVGAGLCCALGFSIGSLTAYPVTGALCGLAYQLAAYFIVHQQMLDSHERGRMKFLRVLDRVMA